MKRRDFIKTAVTAAAGTGLLAGTGGILAGCSGKKAGGPVPYMVNTMGGARMKLSFESYELKLRHTFTVAAMSRNTTPDVQVRIEYDGFTGYGEASMPPYLGQTVESVTSFLGKVDLGRFRDPFMLDDILTYVDGISEGDAAAKAAVDIALHDLVGKLLGQPWFRIWGLDPGKAPDTTFTIGIDTPEVVREKTKECADRFNILKVKVGLDNDKEMITTIREITDLPIAVDANQGWKDKDKALEMIWWLKEHGVVMVEQGHPEAEGHSLHQGSLHRDKHQAHEVHRDAGGLEDAQLRKGRRDEGDDRMYDGDIVRGFSRRTALPRRGFRGPGRKPSHSQRPFRRDDRGRREDMPAGPPRDRSSTTWMTRA